ncbi:MAG: 2-dehydropantoate 2-reductase [Chloroflexi bacterium HGW-Chloroflexi-10]|nr:MAG: 2-dehydropantoate 2-reductase [Chloroflexi bacterium HGW-Chloroflexi-10]
MQEIQKVAILGAGAMGAYFATRFFETGGFSTVLVARGEHFDRLKNQGLVVNGKTYAIPVVKPEAVKGPVDLLIVALKHHHLAAALPGLEKLIGDTTTIISVMNGLESEAIIGSMYGVDKVLYAISLGIDAVREDNRVTYTRAGKHHFGEAKNAQISDRVRRVQQAFDRAGIAYENPEDMIRSMWWKFMVNVGVNQASAVMRAPYGVFHSSADAQGLMETLMGEVVTLAQASGVNLTHKDIEEWYPILRSLSAQGKTSMLQDIEAGRKTEVEVFGGKVVEMGKEYGIPTPANETIVQIIHVLEQIS